MDSPHCVAHCISQDIHMRKGLAGEIRRRFGGIEYLKGQNKKVGEIGVTMMDKIQGREKKYIFHLITKRFYWEKPTAATLAASLENLKLQLKAMDIKDVSVPWLGTGRDRLPRPVVWKMLHEIFRGSGISVTIHERDVF